MLLCHLMMNRSKKIQISYTLTWISVDRFALWFPKENRSRLIPVTVQIHTISQPNLMCLMSVTFHQTGYVWTRPCHRPDVAELIRHGYDWGCGLVRRVGRQQFGTFEGPLLVKERYWWVSSLPQVSLSTVHGISLCHNLFLFIFILYLFTLNRGWWIGVSLGPHSMVSSSNASELGRDWGHWARLLEMGGGHLVGMWGQCLWGFFL